MKTLLYSAIAVIVVYSLSTCTCATTAKANSRFAFANKKCVDKYFDVICDKEANTLLDEEDKIKPDYVVKIAGDCGNAETKECEYFNRRPQLPQPLNCKSFPNFLKQQRLELRKAYNDDIENAKKEECPEDVSN